MLPQRALLLISQYSKPYTRPDWRKGSYLKREWTHIRNESQFLNHIVFNSQIYDLIHDEVELWFENFCQGEIFESYYLPTTHINIQEIATYMANLYEEYDNIDEITECIICNSI